MDILAFVRRHTDLAALVVLFTLSILAEGDLFRDEVTLGMDAATQYYPWYYFLGESLRSGEIPGWNPYQLSGTPFAADPLSGWSYLPAMLLFTFLPLVAAVKALMLSHLLLAGLFTYALARVLGIALPGAFLAAIAYEYSGLFYVQNTCCLQYIGVMAWLPLAILGAELALRSERWVQRGLWWGVSGLGLSQVLASWFGQGAYYALLGLGGYVAYRTLLFPARGETPSGIRGRVFKLVLHGGAVLAFGFALGAAGVLPRLEFNELSNLAGGYPTEFRAQGGLSVADWVLLLKPGLWYAGISILALALVAPVLARGRFAVPYFFALSLGALVLSGQGPTPLHTVLYLLLPRFEELHPHDPDRAVVIFYLGAALLAGATLSALSQPAGKKLLVLVLPVLAALSLAAVSTLFPPIPEGEEGLYPLLGGWEDLYPLLLNNGAAIPVISLILLFSAVTLVVAYALLPFRLAVRRNLTFTLLILVIFTDLIVADRVTIADQSSPTGGAVVIRETDLEAYYRPSGAAQFLQSEEGEEPFRYFSYDPELGETSHISSPARFAQPETHALEANGRAMLTGLQDIQGYNPTHIARYDDYISVMNGSPQNYHFIDVYREGLDSPLLDLLNVRYTIVPTNPSRVNPETARRFELFEQSHPVVYQDQQTKVLENPNALPRAWIVHSALQQNSPQQTLELLNSGQVDPKHSALLQQQPPQELSEANEEQGTSSSDEASVVEYEANRVRLQSSSERPGLLVLSEVYYPAWKAYVDGEPAEVYEADGLLRSVVVPAGEHTVEFRYESWTLQVGVVVSLISGAALIGLAIVAGANRWRENERAASKPKD